MAATKKRGAEALLKKSGPSSRHDDDLDLDFSSDLEGIMSALQQIRERAHKDGQKKNEETIASVTSEITTKIEDLKFKIEKERQSFAKAFSRSSNERENRLKDEAAKFQQLYQQFNTDKVAHLQALKEAISRFEEDKERLYIRSEQLRKKEKLMISEQQKDCADRIRQLEESLKKKKQDNKTFSILRKTLGSFLENASEEDLPPDD